MDKQEKLLANRQRPVPVWQQAIIDKCQHSAGGWEPFPDGEVEQSIGQRFEKMVDRFPDRLAIQLDKIALSYGELNALVNRIVGAILACPGLSSSPIALLLEESIEAYAAVLGVLKLGRAYVILDPSFPQENLAYLLQDSTAGLVITDSAHLPLLSQLDSIGKVVLCLDQIETEMPMGNPHIPVAPGQVAAILYTSGSTGRPKGVYTSHRNLLQLVQRVSNSLHISPEDRRGNVRAFGSNMAVIDVLLSVLTGSASILYQIEQRGTQSLLRWISEDQITVAVFAMPVYRQIIDSLADDSTWPLRHLRVFVIGGETITRSDIEAYNAYFPAETILTLGYGVTELPGVTYYFADQQTDMGGPPMPSGYPLEGVEIAILDESGQRLGVEQPGEIVLYSDYLALGYWGKPAQTQEKFRTDAADGRRYYMTGDLGKLNADGCLIHLGRKDFQVKISGFRVEIAEVEHALFELDEVRSAAVVAHPDSAGGHRLVAYIVPSTPQPPFVSQLHQKLAARLPDYMVPGAFVFLDALPLLPSGKVNRLSLAPPKSQRPHLAVVFTPAGTPFEKAISTIWADILGLDEIGIHDPFLELGGNSLQAMRIASRVQDEFGVEIPLPELFAAGTVAEMALLIVAHLAIDPNPVDLI
ncbi:MAG: non-ribosomal peptide synthetase [Caldilineaceae bacterium]